MYKAILIIVGFLFLGSLFFPSKILATNFGGIEGSNGECSVWQGGGKSDVQQIDQLFPKEISDKYKNCLNAQKEILDFCQNAGYDSFWVDRQVEYDNFTDETYALCEDRVAENITCPAPSKEEDLRPLKITGISDDSMQLIDGKEFQVVCQFTCYAWNCTQPVAEEKLPEKGFLARIKEFLLNLRNNLAAIFSPGTAKLSTPVLARNELITKEAFVKGRPNAPVFLVEFADLECPPCKTFQPVIDKLLLENKGKFTFAMRHFPLEGHRFAFDSAVAAEAAGKQGKFWEMVDLIFGSQEKLDADIFKNLASKLKLDVKKFSDDFSSGDLREKIKMDMEYGKRVGVGQTPVFFLNGKRLEYPKSYQELIDKVNSEIETAK